jgi:hypothetical protein
MECYNWGGWRGCQGEASQEVSSIQEAGGQGEVGAGVSHTEYPVTKVGWESELERVSNKILKRGGGMVSHDTQEAMRNGEGVKSSNSLSDNLVYKVSQYPITKKRKLKQKSRSHLRRSRGKEQEMEDRGERMMLKSGAVHDTI